MKYLYIALFLLSSNAEAFSSKHESRRTFLVEKVISASTIVVLTPKDANAEENDSDFFKAAQARFKSRMAAKSVASKDKERPVKRKERQEQDDGDGFVFSSKVEEIQEKIAKNKEEAILFDKEETIRSENNEFIKELKARSDAKKEQYKQESMRPDKLSSKQFKDNLNRPSYTGVTLSDGSLRMVSDTQLKELENANRIKISYETSTRKDGTEFTDYSKKLVLLLDDETAPSSAGKDQLPLEASESIEASESTQAEGVGP